jgi:hypothetical protein
VHRARGQSSCLLSRRDQTVRRQLATRTRPRAGPRSNASDTSRGSDAPRLPGRRAFKLENALAPTALRGRDTKRKLSRPATRASVIRKTSDFHQDSEPDFPLGWLGRACLRGTFGRSLNWRRARRNKLPIRKGRTCSRYSNSEQLGCSRPSRRGRDPPFGCSRSIRLRKGCSTAQALGDFCSMDQRDAMSQAHLSCVPAPVNALAVILQGAPQVFLLRGRYELPFAVAIYERRLTSSRVHGAVQKAALVTLLHVKQV